jgi:hypothetical protein
MAARKTASKGAKPDKLMRDALMVALKREAKGADGKPTRRLYIIADRLVEKAMEGEIAAIREIADRVDGKAGALVAGDNGDTLALILAGLKVTLGAKLDRIADRDAAAETEKKSE